MKVEAVIFDMDGVIIDSEPFWRQAEMEVFNSMGIPMSDEMCRGMKGIKIDEVVKHWYFVYKWQSPDIKTVELAIIRELQDLIKGKGKPMEGLSDLIEFLKLKKIKIGLATSSLYSIMDVVLETLRISNYFDVVHSAESEKAGKPAPDVYIGAALKLGVSPENCIAIEDSLAGLNSAIAASMFTIALPENGEFDSEIFNIADKKVKSLSEIKELDLFE